MRNPLRILGLIHTKLKGITNYGTKKMELGDIYRLKSNDFKGRIENIIFTTLKIARNH